MMTIPNLPIDRSKIEILPTREAWKKARSHDHRIGGSDVAQILDRSPNGGPWAFWTSRLHPSALDALLSDDSADKSRGRRYEVRVLEDYASDYHLNVWLPRKIVGAAAEAEVVVHGEQWWMAATPDAFVFDALAGTWGGAEAKTSAIPDLWGPECEIRQWDETMARVVPVHYALQTYWYLAITGLPWWDLVVLIISQANSALQLRRYRFYADHELQRRLIEAVQQWRQEHLIDGVPPTVTGESECRDWLGTRFGKSSMVREPSPKETALAAEFAALKLRIAADQERCAVLENQLLDSMKEADGIFMPGPNNGKRPVLRRIVVGAHTVKAIPERKQAACAYLKMPTKPKG